MTKLLLPLMTQPVKMLQWKNKWCKRRTKKKITHWLSVKIQNQKCCVDRNWINKDEQNANKVRLVKVSITKKSHQKCTNEKNINHYIKNL